jgi:Uncharacterized protein conserved in cyanobacteria
LKYGVSEYWIVNPMLNTVQLYCLNENGLYDQITVAKDSGMVTSQIIEDFKVELEDIFV